MTDPLTPDQLAAIRADLARWDELAHMTTFQFLDAHGTEEVNRLKDRYRKAIPGLLAMIEAQQKEIERLSIAIPPFRSGELTAKRSDDPDVIIKVAS